MCGIAGIFGKQTTDIDQVLDVLANRGRDHRQTHHVANGVVGHVLHATTGFVKQPLVHKSTLVFNGQIYNYKELAQTHGYTVKNDTELLLKLLEQPSSTDIHTQLDGVYAYAHCTEETVTLTRDVLGVKPLFYAHTKEVFAFASEPKALKKIGLLPRELHPRTTLTYDVKAHTITTRTRPLKFTNTHKLLHDLLLDAVKKRIPESNKVGVLFSGGVDSSLLALLAKQLGADVTLYVAALDDPQKKAPADLVAARTAAKKLDLPLVECTRTLGQVDELLPTVCEVIESSNVVKVGVALPFFIACQQAAADGQRVLLSGLGAEEVFAGYHRHKQAVDINKECVRGLRKMHERDLFRDDVVSMYHGIELRLPLLDHALIAHGLAIDADKKIIDSVTKYPLRQAAHQLGLDESIAFRKKKAAQYGSQFDAAIKKLARRDSKSKSAYLESYYPTNKRLCALLSSGKDSVYALYTMQQLNYEISCCATIISDNQDSYMYHTPAVSFAQLQAESMQLPLLTQTTPGNKEEELSALREVLRQAINTYAIEGVVSGALYSDYQRSRIEAVCEELGLQVYAPLWHLDQEMEVREIIDAGFEFVLSKVAAYGLDKSWVGKVITHEHVDALTKKLGLNVAGEGGEYESLVLNGPNFRSPITLEDVSIECESEGSAPVCTLHATGRL